MNGEYFPEVGERLFGQYKKDNTKELSVKQSTKTDTSISADAKQLTMCTGPFQ
jgi:hypothetical protein